MIQSYEESQLHEFCFNFRLFIEVAASYNQDAQKILNLSETVINFKKPPLNGNMDARNNYSKKVTHGEAVLSGMMLATKLSVMKKVCSTGIFLRIKNIYLNNSLDYTFRKYSKKDSVNKLIPYLKNDKKNNDNKINFILLKKIGKTVLPNKSKISINNFKKLSKAISQY